MRRWAHLVCAGWLAWLLAVMSIAAAPGIALAGTAAAPPPPSTALNNQYVQASNDGSLTLQAGAPAAPASYGSFKHFGLTTSSKQQFSTPFQRIEISYTSRAPAGSAVRVDLRASADGTLWSEWQLDLPSGAKATFARPMLFAQYRVALLGNGRSQPSIGGIQLTPERGAAIFSMMQESQPVAPTWKLRATRMGMVGGRTANGHRITPRDRFVSLPSRRSLAPDGTNDYQVRITYNGRSSVAPVYDVGPWNSHDDYWNESRERYNDLPRGWPEDHAAFFDKYNGGMAEKGRVRFPSAIDVGDGVWLDDLGIKGDQATVEVTFLWLGNDPLAGAPPAEPPAPPPPAPPAPPAEPPAPPPPAPPAPPAEPPAPPPPAPPAPANEIVVDSSTEAFHGQAAVRWDSKTGDCGTNGQTLWTYSTTNPADSENTGRWQPSLPGEAMYDVYVAIPSCGAKKPNTNSARYLVQHRDGASEVVIDQAATAGTWVRLGSFPFKAGDGGFVELRDITGDSMRTIWFDAVKWVPSQ